MRVDAGCAAAAAVVVGAGFDDDMFLLILNDINNNSMEGVYTESLNTSVWILSQPIDGSTATELTREDSIG